MAGHARRKPHVNRRPHHGKGNCGSGQCKPRGRGSRRAGCKRAFYDGRWSKKSPGERSKIIWKLADLLEANAESLAKVESENTGKPYQYVSLGGDIPFAVDNLRFFAGAARDTHG